MESRGIGKTGGTKILHGNTIATETTNDDKLLKTLVGLERQTPNPTPEGYKPYITILLIKLDVVLLTAKTLS